MKLACGVLELLLFALVALLRKKPDRRVWCELNDEVYFDELEETIEEQLIRARNHGVNGQITVTATKHVDGTYTYDYEPVKSIPQKGPPPSRKWWKRG